MNNYVNCVFFVKTNPLTLSLFKFIILLSVYIKVKVNISLSDFVKEGFRIDEKNAFNSTWFTFLFV